MIPPTARRQMFGLDFDHRGNGFATRILSDRAPTVEWALWLWINGRGNLSFNHVRRRRSLRIGEQNSR